MTIETRASVWFVSLKVLEATFCVGVKTKRPTRNTVCIRETPVKVCGVCPRRQKILGTALKWTRELVGFEDLNISPIELTTEPENRNENEEDDSDSSSESSDSQFSSASDQEYDSTFEAPLLDVKESHTSKKAKLVCQFFFSSLEGEFSRPVATFPLHKINHRILSTLVWQVCESIGGLKLDSGKKYRFSMVFLMAQHTLMLSLVGVGHRIG